MENQAEHLTKDDRPLILIVDDNVTNIDLLVSSLKSEYHLGIAKHGAAAIEYARKYMPTLILLDIMMPEMDGYDVCRILKDDPLTAAIPIIFITAMHDTSNKTRGFELGAVDYITKPFHMAEVKARLRTHISLEAMRAQLQQQNQHLEECIAAKTVELREMLNGSIISMAKMVEIRDPYTAGHQQRVANLACAIAGKLGLSKKEIQGICIAGLLHDIGKIRIPVSVLARAGELLEAELDFIKMHPTIGFEILEKIPFPWPVAKAVLQHHEHLDGSGYPRGVMGNDIIMESKILTVADVTEAKSSFRPYRPALGIEAGIEEINKYKSVYYDREVVEACTSLLEEKEFSFEEPGNGSCIKMV